MELHQLRYVVAVVDEGSFTAAAVACFVAQPSLSHAVRILERELGVELFQRVGRRVRLTAAGQAFVPGARETLRSLETARREVQAVNGVVSGWLDLVALPTLAVDPVAPLVGRFRTAHPGVVVRLAHPDRTDELVQQVADGASEVGITELPVRGERVRTTPLGPQELVVVLPPSSAIGGSLALAALARQPFVTLPPGTSTRDALDGALASIGAVATVAVETDQREAIVPLVLAGAGAALLPRPMAELAARQGAAVAAVRPRLRRELGLVTRDATLSPAARAFVSLAGPDR